MNVSRGSGNNNSALNLVAVLFGLAGAISVTIYFIWPARHTYQLLAGVGYFLIVPYFLRQHFKAIAFTACFKVLGYFGLALLVAGVMVRFGWL